MLKTLWFALLALALCAFGANGLFRRETRPAAPRREAGGRGGGTAGRPAAHGESGNASQDVSYREIDTYLEQQLARLNIPGAALAIVEGDRIVHLRGFGQARPGGAAPTPQTPFFIGSLTKSFTALAVMQLVEAGKIALDAPVQRYLPWFRVADPQASARTPALAPERPGSREPERAPGSRDSAGASVTVRHLLNQTSGLAQTAGMIPLADFDDRPDAVERQARALATFTPARSPGAAWEYSNLNYNLLGLIIAAASGESYEAYIRNHIFAPLEMRHSHTAKAAAHGDGLAVGHRAWFGVPIPVPDLAVPTGSLPSGQLIASAEDVAHYLIAHLNGGRYGDAQLLSPQGMAELHRPATKAASMGVEMGAYGMGWFVQETDQGTRVWHNGQTPDFFAYMALLPEQGRGLVLLVNANQMLLNFALLGVSEGAAALLAGAQPDRFPWGVIPWVLRSFLLIPAIALVDVLATRRRVQRWRVAPGRRPGPGRLWAWHTQSVPLAVLYLALVLIACVLLTSALRKMLLLFMPDLSWLALVCGGFALVWVFVRSERMLATSFGILDK